MTTFINKIKNFSWLIGLGVGAVVTYTSIQYKNTRQDERIEKLETQIIKMTDSLQVFYEFYRMNECSRLAEERKDNEYADLTYKQLCITGTFK